MIILPDSPTSKKSDPVGRIALNNYTYTIWSIDLFREADYPRILKEKGECITVYKVEHIGSPVWEYMNPLVEGTVTVPPGYYVRVIAVIGIPALVTFTRA